MLSFGQNVSNKLVFLEFIPEDSAESVKFITGHTAEREIHTHTYTYTNTMKTTHKARAGVAQWPEHWSAHRKVPTSILSQGACLGCQPGSRLVVCPAGSM